MKLYPRSAKDYVLQEFTTWLMSLQTANLSIVIDSLKDRSFLLAAKNELSERLDCEYD